jgi:hypothetical protein
MEESRQNILAVDDNPDNLLTPYKALIREFFLRAFGVDRVNGQQASRWPQGRARRS